MDGRRAAVGRPLGELVPARTPGTRYSALTILRQERENLVTRIRAQVNDKRQYAQVRVVAEMCAESPFVAVGDEASAAAITPQSCGLLLQEASHCPDRVLLSCGSAP